MRQRHAFLLGFTAIAATLPWCERAHAQASVQPLPGLAGSACGQGGRFDAYDLSNGGTTVVGTGCDSDFDRVALRWTAVDGTQDIGNLGGDARGYGVSADGSVIVGVSETGPLTPSPSRAFRWTQSGGIVDLGVLTGFGQSAAFGVSGDGNVVVGGSFNRDGHTVTGSRAFRWTEAGGMQNLGTLPGIEGFYTAYAANSDGSVVVGGSGGGGFDKQVGGMVDRYGGNDLLAGDRAWRWTESAGMVDLGTFAGAPGGARAYDVDGGGNVVVGLARISATTNHAFRWTPEQGMIDLGGFGGLATTSYASSVSADGRIVVGASEMDWSRDLTGLADMRVFVWTEEGGMVDLRALLGMNGVPVADLSFGGEFAQGPFLSPDGLFIAGDEYLIRLPASLSLPAAPAPPAPLTGYQGSLTVPGGFAGQEHLTSVAGGLSDDGSAFAYTVGTQFGELAEQSTFRAARWTGSGGAVDLGSLAGPDGNSFALNISGDGLVVVGDSDTPDGSSQAFRWSQAGGMTGLGSLIGADGFSTARAANRDGSVIVGDSDAEGFLQRAFRWTEA
ncbi:MAG TPA: hypothetical protein VF727_03065, partial [Allosphingosinicella sp.]